jgi:hypothetical protein
MDGARSESGVRTIGGDDQSIFGGMAPRRSGILRWVREPMIPTAPRAISH